MDVVNKNYKRYFLPTNIRVLRKRMHWSQEELAKKVGLNRGNIASYEAGTAEPKICNLLKMSQLFGVSLLTLIQTDMNESTAQAVDQALTNATPFPFEMQEYRSKAQELQRVMEGLNICCRYKVKNMNGNLPKEMQLVALHFEELYDTAQTLLEQHLALLQDVNCPELNSTSESVERI